MNCPNCGYANPEGAVFCGGCGNKFDTQAVNVTPAEPIQVEEQPVDQTNVPPAQPTYTIPNTPAMNWNQTQPTTEEPTSVLKWLGLMLLEAFVGIVHIIMMFVFAFSSKTEKSLKNYSIAKLIMAGIGLVLSIVIVIVMVTLGVSLGSALATEDIFADDYNYDYDYGYDYDYDSDFGYDYDSYEEFDYSQLF